MDGRGRALDNIFVERLWRSVKYECTYLQQFETVATLRETLKKYFLFYNRERFHQSLNYKTPEEVYFENIDKKIDTKREDLISCGNVEKPFRFTHSPTTTTTIIFLSLKHHFVV
jgi:putative transposase